VVAWFLDLCQHSLEEAGEVEVVEAFHLAFLSFLVVEGAAEATSGSVEGAGAA